MPTIRDIRRIVHLSQRKKNIIPEHATLTNTYNHEIVKQRNNLQKEINPDRREAIQTEISSLNRLKEQAEEQIFAETLHKLETYILKQPNTIRLKKRHGENRDILTFNKTNSKEVLFDQYCALRLSDAYKIRMTGRDQNVRVLIDALKSTEGSNITKRGIIRFDVRRFYDSIDHTKILNRIESHAGIPSYVQKHIRSILDAYKRIYGRDQGIPQGVPSSSKLAEIYLERFDARISRDPAVSLYIRYVDDATIICEQNELDRVTKMIDDTLAEIGLEINNQKHDTVFHPFPKKTHIDYLGYRFSFLPDNSRLDSIDISPEKSDRYVKAINKLDRYAHNIACWTSPDDVNHFLAAAEYLYLPHTSQENTDSIRILSGLAYSARFMVGHHTSQPNFKKILSSGIKSKYSLLKLLQSNKSRPLLCPCCSQPPHRATELEKYANEKPTFRTIMKTNCLPHHDDDTRRAVSRTLWN